MPFTRRQFLRQASGGILIPALASCWAERTEASSSAPPESVFPLSVASGDPSPTGVILWTYVAPQARVPGGTLVVQVAIDANLTDLVAEFEVPRETLDAETDGTIRISLDGWLSSGRTYYYRFVYEGVASRVGRCRTLPAPGAAISRLTFGVVTCQDYTNGYFGALARLADRDVDFVVHLGDFIYETVGDPSFQSLPFPDRRIVLPSGRIAAMGLEDYRFLYRHYRSDPLLQKLLERHTLIAIWDDHETANDCYWDYTRDTLGAPDHPLSSNGGDPARLRQLKLDAMRAWSEYLPTAVAPDPSATHPFDYFQIYREFRFGSLVDLFMTDERTYRSPHPCGEDERLASTGCFQQLLPSQTMLGTRQRNWLIAGMSRSPARWKVWGNSVFQGALKLGRTRWADVYASTDAWDGYEGERAIIMRALKRAGVKNLVALTGDLHTYMASLLKISYADRDNTNVDNLVGVEFMTPAVTSSNIRDLLSNLNSDLSIAARKAKLNLSPNLIERVVLQTNPHIHFFNSDFWGYSTVEFTPQHCTYTAYKVDKTTNSPAAAESVLRQIRTPVDNPRFIDLV